MKFIAIPTYKPSELLPRMALSSPGNGNPDLFLSKEHLELALDIIAKSGGEVVVESPVWSDPTIDWSKFSLILLRDTWDYDRHSELFRKWLKSLTVPVLNPVDTVLWNINKTYLRELASAGVDVVPTLFLCRTQWQAWADHNRLSNSGPATFGDLLTSLLGQSTPADLSCSVEDFSVKGSFVIKPSISLGGQNMCQVDMNSPLEKVLAHINSVFDIKNDRETVILIQPLVEEIIVEGETSLIFLHGEFSHAVRKVPKTGEFRVHEDLGGTSTLVEGEAHLIAFGQAALAAAKGLYDPQGKMTAPLFYSRVDYVLKDGTRPLVMEVELIEPSLFLTICPAAAAKFSDMVLAVLADV
ncbi:hypothetical protein BASA50_010348 [Batrachochytrium salamandrivorans]|uniref:Prokaryotic glutathione synthetase ATP-binding domain-containing protein n=1 Tax=Batrachochytrium salamandrivorans TaxID=1357716 RepID=A0ABQ8EZV5_9FUNG|nr:hypothetical protein BASA50_010348 [Batrachochytrium salamandrivorans]